jgi:hypothetical protein
VFPHVGGARPSWLELVLVLEALGVSMIAAVCCEKTLLAEAPLLLGMMRVHQ